MQDIQTYLDAGWDMVGERENGTADIWRMPEGGGYPELAVFSEGYQQHTLSGSGTPEDQYQIGTAEDLGAINHHDESAFYELVADIDLSGITWNTSPVAKFNGGLDGNSYRIMNLTLTVDRQTLENIGLFGSIGDNGYIWNLGLENVSITSPDNSKNVGGLAGFSNGDINNCYVNGRIFTDNDSSWLGLLVGGNGGGDITNCYAAGNIFTGDNSFAIGGLTAYSNGNIVNCYVFSSISCGNNGNTLGGLVGLNWENIITNCYAVTSISAGDNSADIGGLVGDTWGNSIISNSYFLTESESSGPDNELGLPLTDEQMKQQSSFVDWDFDEIWMICEGIDYPRLQWQNVQCEGQ